MDRVKKIYIVPSLTGNETIQCIVTMPEQNDRQQMREKERERQTERTVGGEGTGQRVPSLIGVKHAQCVDQIGLPHIEHAIYYLMVSLIMKGWIDLLQR